MKAASALGLANGRIDGLRWVPGVNLHVTACFIGEVSPDKLPGPKTATREILLISANDAESEGDLHLAQKETVYGLGFI